MIGDHLLSEFVTEHREEIMARCIAKTAAHTSLPASEVMRGIPLFVDQLVEVLQGKQHVEAAVTNASTARGAELLRRGFTIGQVVHDYGHVCQTVTSLAIERGHQIVAEEFQLLNLCVDNAIAGAVTEYVRRRELEVAADIRDRSTDDLELLSYEVGNLVWSAALAFDALITGPVAATSSTSAVVRRSLASLRGLLERSFAAMKLKGRGGAREAISLGELIAVVKLTVDAVAMARGIPLAVELRDAGAVVEADLQILAPIVAQLVENACHHTPAAGHVALRSSATADRVRIEIEDECGGLPPGASTAWFQPTASNGKEHTGLGLDLRLIQRGIEVIGGTIGVRDLPGTGCVFTVELPRRSSTAQRQSTHGEPPGRGAPGAPDSV